MGAAQDAGRRVVATDLGAPAHGRAADLVYVPSEPVPGFVTAERQFRPYYLPVDEADHHLC